jgi:tetratricopeptide (TPR) repeat protein
MNRIILCVMMLMIVAGCASKKKRDAKKTAATENQPPKLINRTTSTFETMSDDPPLNANTRFAAGQLAEAQGDRERAVNQYREALKIEPHHQNALFRLGAIYTAARRYDDAIATWQQYIKATRNASAAYNNLAYCYEQAGKLLDAEATYKSGIERDPQSSTCRVNYGLMLARHERIEESLAQLRMALSPAEVHYNLGAVCEQKGRLAQAKAYYEKALELDPNLVDARTKLTELK